MTEADELQNLGRIASRYAVAKRNLLIQREEVATRAHVFARLAQAFGSKEIYRILNDGEVTISSLREDGFDWSKLTKESLSALLDHLRSAESEEKLAKQEKIDARI
jgi:uncharacterized protein with von Willebrand factor type A (vWA) domain